MFFDIAWNGSPWHKMSSAFTNTSTGNSWSGPWSTRSHQHRQEKDRVWILQAVQRQCWCWNRQVCQSSWCGCSSSILFKVTGLLCQWNYSTINQELLRRGSSKVEGQRWRRYCCSSLEKAWKATTPWWRVGLQLYLKRVKDSGGVVSARTAIAAARGHFTEVCKLAEFGGHAKVNRQWAHSLLKCMKFVQRKATTAKSKASKANFAEQKKMLLNNVLATVNMNKILVKFILNWEQTGI